MRGTVYLARDERLGRQVALKLVEPRPLSLEGVGALSGRNPLLEKDLSHAPRFAPLALGTQILPLEQRLAFLAITNRLRLARFHATLEIGHPNLFEAIDSGVFTPQSVPVKFRPRGGPKDPSRPSLPVSPPQTGRKWMAM